MAVLDRKQLEESPLSDLHAIASELGIEGYRLLRREKLIDSILGGGGGDAGDSGDAGESGGDAPARAERPRQRRSRGGRGRGSQGGDRAPRGGRDDDDDSDDDEERPRGRRGGGGRARAASRDQDDRDDDDRDAGDDAEEELTGEVRSGVLDILPNGSGFVRPQAFQHSPDDVYVSPAQIRRLELRSGDRVEGPVRPPRRNERHPSLARVDNVNGADADPDSVGDRKRFDDLTPVFATQRLAAPDGLDAVPFGRGSRVAVGGPPGSGITTLLRKIVATLAGDGLDVVVVLAGARPEEVTEWRREAQVEVAGAGFDRPVDEQAQAAEMAVERGKRTVEQGGHAAIVVDSLDALPPSVARRVFGAARATEEAGTLTIFASTGLAGEPMRLATTRIVLEAAEPGQKPDPPKLAPASGTLRADLLS